MSDDYREFVAAARIIKKANAMLGNGEKCSWTADDFFDLASSVAAEAGTVGRCPICGNEVHANSSARIAKHRDNAGRVGRTHGVEPTQVQHQLYGWVNSWPAWVWDLAADGFA